LQLEERQLNTVYLVSLEARLVIIPDL